MSEEKIKNTWNDDQHFTFGQGWRASAPGKLLLSGEHAVVHKQRALASVLQQNTSVSIFNIIRSKNLNDTIVIRLHVTKSQHIFSTQQLAPIIRLFLSLHIKDNANIKAFSLNEQVWQAICQLTNNQSCQIVLFYFIVFLAQPFALQSPLTRVLVDVAADLPVGAGLGSSASFCVALAAAFHSQLRSISTTTSTKDNNNHASQVYAPDDSIKVLVNDWAYEGERILHGNPSGVDNTVCTFGGAIIYRRGQPFLRINQLPPLRILVTNTKVSRNTKALVSGVGELAQATPHVAAHIFTAIDHITQMWIDAFQLYQSSHSSPSSLTSIFEKCGLAIKINQDLLNAIGVGHASIDEVVRIGHSLHFPTKLSGAGGGGCVISLLPPNVKDEDIKKFKELSHSKGMETFESFIGQHGLMLQSLSYNKSLF